jgi:4-amino-4-deoxy-L-arabinose transferase-like glycosyltransferase
MWKKETMQAAIILLVVGIFLFFQCMPSLEVPALHSDEAKSGAAAISLIKNYPTRADLQLWGRHFPLGIGRHGAIDAYFQAPLLFFTGNTLEGLRITPIIIGVLIIICTYLLGCRIFNPAVGSIAAIFVGLNPFFMKIVKQGGDFGCAIPLFQIFSVWLFLRYHITKKLWYFIGTALVLGLGLNSKGFFIWFILAAVITYFICYYPRHKIPAGSFFLGAACFFLSAAPVGYYYAKINFFGDYGAKNFYKVYSGVNNTGIFSDFSTVIDNFNHALSDNNFSGESSLLPEFLLIFAVSYLLCKIFLYKKANFSKTRLLGMCLLVLITLFNSAFSFSEHSHGHLFIIFPFFQIFMAASLFEILQDFLPGQIKRVVIFSIVLSLGVYYLNNLAAKYKQSIKTLEKVRNGFGEVYMTRWLVENSVSKLTVFGAYNIKDILEYCSGLKISLEYYWPRNAMDEHSREWNLLTIKRIFNRAKPGEMLLFQDFNCRSLENYGCIEDIARELNVRWSIVKEFPTLNKTRHYTLIQINF